MLTNNISQIMNKLEALSGDITQLKINDTEIYEKVEENKNTIVSKF